MNDEVIESDFEREVISIRHNSGLVEALSVKLSSFVEVHTCTHGSRPSVVGRGPFQHAHVVKSECSV